MVLERPVELSGIAADACFARESASRIRMAANAPQNSTLIQIIVRRAKRFRCRVSPRRIRGSQVQSRDKSDGPGSSIGAKRELNQRDRYNRTSFIRNRPDRVSLIEALSRLAVTLEEGWERWVAREHIGLQLSSCLSRLCGRKFGTAGGIRHTPRVFAVCGPVTDIDSVISGVFQGIRFNGL